MISGIGGHRMLEVPSKSNGSAWEPQNQGPRRHHGLNSLFRTLALKWLLVRIWTALRTFAPIWASIPNSEREQRMIIESRAPSAYVRPVLFKKRMLRRAAGDAP